MGDLSNVMLKDVKKAMRFDHDDLLIASKLPLLFTRHQIQDRVGKKII